MKPGVLPIAVSEQASKLTCSKQVSVADPAHGLLFGRRCSFSDDLNRSIGTFVLMGVTGF